MSRTITVLNPGALSLVQDPGRQGFQRYGVSVSGAMDPDALLVGNLLVGNDHDAAAIEVTFGGAEFMFNEEAIVAVTGCDLEVLLDGTRLPTWESFVAPAGSVIRLGAAAAGLRAYAAINGGIDTNPVLNSRSTHMASGLGGLEGKALVADDDIPLGVSSETATAGARFPDDLRNAISRELAIRVVAGPQSSSFTAAGEQTFFSSAYTVTDRSDRQGLRLEGPVIEAVEGRYDIISDAVVFGAVQVPGDGKPIVLLADRQTTGGYAKIAVVASVDLPLLAQASPGTVLRFKGIPVEEAQTLLRERRAAILGADLTGDLETYQANVAFAGHEREISLGYRHHEVVYQGGGVVSASINGVRTTARAEQMQQ